MLITLAGLALYIAVLLTVLIFKLNKGVQQVQSLEHIISEKLKSKFEIIDNMSVVEAQKKVIRFKSILFEMLEESAPIWTNIIGKALGGKSSSSGGYREGG